MINSTTQLLNTEYSEIELAEIKLVKSNPHEQIAGRIVGEPIDGELQLRYRGHTHTVENVHEWTLDRYKPVTDMERRMIRSEWD